MIESKPVEKAKRIRTDKQKEAFDKARKTRADNIEARKLEKQEKSKQLAEEQMVLIKKSEEQKEPETKVEVKDQPKPTKSNDFPKASTGINPMNSINKKNKNIEVEVIPPPEKKVSVKKPVEEKEEIVIDVSDTDSSVDLNEWLNEPDTESESESEEEIVIKTKKNKSVSKPKPKPKKVVYVSESESEEEDDEDYEEEESEEVESINKNKKAPKSKPQTRSNTRQNKNSTPIKTTSQPKMSWRDSARLAGF